MNKVLEEDIKNFSSNFILKNELFNKTILLTGATGLLGSCLVYCLLDLQVNIKIIAPVRDLNKAKRLFYSCLNSIELIECDLSTYSYCSIPQVDYIIHCASPTSSKFFVDKAVETFSIILESTQRLLEYAVTHSVRGFVFLSSIEIYGVLKESIHCVTEEKLGYLDLLSIRSSYPMAKRAVENLCCLYSNEYGVPVKIARLTQTTGAGISKDDNRIIAQFTRKAVQGQDIVLHSTGESARSYCYTMDAISAILYILIKGKKGEAYNVANQSAYISARDLAFFIKEKLNQKINVKFEINENMGYAPCSKINLSTSKLSSLGWAPYYSLQMIIERLSLYLKDSETLRNV